jgi:flagellar hook-associated protein 1 FlgK
MSLLSLLSIARSALLAHQRAMAVTGHNVANAQTPGYSRQRLILVAASPQSLPEGVVGRGVTAATIVRTRDRFYDATFRRESGLLGDAATLRGHLSQVEGAFAEPSDLGVAAALDGVFQAFGDLSNDPAGALNRDLVRQAAGRFVQRLRQLDGQLAEVAADALARLRGQLDEVNALAGQIASLNAEILASGGARGSAPDLEDQRDLLVDRLSNLMAVRVLERGDGTIGVMAGDLLLVDGTAAQRLEARAVGGGWEVGVAGGGRTVAPGAGSVHALTDLLGSTLPALRTRLDGFAAAVVTEFNAIHRTGYTLAGAIGVDFFDPAGVTAGSISLSSAVLASGDAIAASATGAPGDGGIALRLAGLADAMPAALGGRTLRGLYSEVAAMVGTGVRDASQREAIHQSLADRADLSRASLSGVSVDEEMVLLIAQQQAYGAAARLVRVADDMMQDLMRQL